MAFASGVNTTSPAIRATLPWLALPAAVSVKVSPSTSVSFATRTALDTVNGWFLERRESVMDTIATLAEGKTAINTQVAIGEFAACRKGARLDEETQSLRGRASTQRVPPARSCSAG